MKKWNTPTISKLCFNKVKGGTAIGFAEQINLYTWPSQYLVEGFIGSARNYESYGCGLLNSIPVGSGSFVIWEDGTISGTDTVSFNGMPCS